MCATILLSHKVIAVSKITAEQVLYMPFCRNKVTTIHNAIEPFAFLTKEQSLEQLTKLGKISFEYDSPILLTIAELHRNKGLDIALQTLKELKKERLHFSYIVIGEGEERLPLQKLIDEYGLRKHVHMIGALPDAKRYLKVGDMFLLPSRTEAFGYVLLEAGIAELPIVASNAGGVVEIVEDGHTGHLVDKNNPKALKSALLNLIENPEKAKIMAQNLHKKILREYNLEDMLKKTEALYEK
jgi:glycosyltransferase involved in cell wall biosynthesis